MLVLEFSEEMKLELDTIKSKYGSVSDSLLATNQEKAELIRNNQSLRSELQKAQMAQSTARGELESLVKSRAQLLAQSGSSLPKSQPKRNLVYTFCFWVFFENKTWLFVKEFWQFFVKKFSNKPL